MAAEVYRQTHSPGRLAWSEGWQPPGTQSATLHSASEPDELSQWLRS